MGMLLLPVWAHFDRSGIFMHLPHFGQYHFNAKRLAFRNDCCNRCGPVRSYKVRTLDVVSVSMVPVLPIGHGERWLCRRCGLDPHRVVETRRGYIILFTIIMGLVTGLLWWSAFYEKPEERIGAWIARVLFTAATAGLIVYLRKRKDGRTLREKLGSVPPAKDTVCPIDGETLVYSLDMQCPKCGIIRESYIPLDEIP